MSVTGSVCEMKCPSAHKAKKPFFAGLSCVCLLMVLSVGRLAVLLFAPAEDPLGYGGLGIALAGLFPTLIAGTSLVVASLIRSEHPDWFLSLVCRAMQRSRSGCPLICPGSDQKVVFLF